MKSGIILTHVSTLGKKHLMFFTGEHWTGGKVVQSVQKLDVSAEAAARSFIVLYGPDIEWLSGPAATRAIARKLKLKYRVRAPGAGRPTLTEAQKVKQVGLWMTQGGIDEMNRQVKATKPKRTNGQHLETLLSANAANL